MNFKFDDKVVKINKIEDEEFNISNFTERKLHKFHNRISIRGEDKEWFDNLIDNSRSGGIYEVDRDNNPIKEYSIYKKSYSYQGNNKDDNTIYTYTLEFNEVEIIEIETLEIDNISLKPYKYNENYDNGIIINANVKLTKEEYDAINKIADNKKYFDVVRKGISDKKIRMRFGQNNWSEHEDNYKIALVLVEECYDNERGQKKRLFEPELSNIKKMLASTLSINNELINYLMDKDILNKDDMEEIKKKAQGNYNDVYRKFYKVKDIDEF